MDRMRFMTALMSWIMLAAFLSNYIAREDHPQQGIPRHLLLEQVSGNATGMPNNDTLANSDQACKDVRTHFGYPDSCSFVQAHKQCQAGGLIEYTQVFFCKFGASPWLAYVLLGLWLVALFYMLGNTAADYFCCSLQKLSSLLRLPPTVAGVTLLPLGNGAPDVFASIAAFVGAEAGEVGLNSVLGGAVFVTCIVGGLVYVVSSRKSSVPVRLDRYCFIRDVSFFLFALLCLVWILHVGEVHLWGAVAFMSIYLVYAITVAASEIIKQKASTFNWHQMQAMPHDEEVDLEEGWYLPVVDPDSGDDSSISLPQWRWASHVAIYAHQQPVEEDSPRPLWGWSEQEESSKTGKLGSLLCKVLLDWPLTLPRQLTIPLVEDSRWCRPVAISSATLAPILVASLLGGGTSLYAYLWGTVTGLLLGLVAYLTTVNQHPPRTFVFPWVAAGFFMSVVWFYIIAKELVAVLVSLGVILDIDSSILGLTVLAWGNSMGDLMANVAMAYNNGGDGVQVAVSGCYAGPMFNTLVGLGASLVLASWHSYPAAFVVPGDKSLYFTVGFLVVGLFWVLALLPSRRMQPSRILGIGLLVLYSLFLSFRMSQALGLFSWA